MSKEIAITINGNAASRVVGGARLTEIAALLAAEPEVYIVVDDNVSWVDREVAAAVPGVRFSLIIDAT